jgi:twitching motility protein PilT
MSLVPSLLHAIVQLNSDTLVMHVGDKPYAVTPTGQVELSTRALTFEAVSGIVAQLMPLESLRALDDFGAAEYALPPTEEHPGERFTIVVARGGNDLWAEIRRGKVRHEDSAPAAVAPAVPEPVVAAPAGLAPQTAVPGVAQDLATRSAALEPEQLISAQQAATQQPIVETARVPAPQPAPAPMAEWQPILESHRVVEADRVILPPPAIVEAAPEPIRSAAPAVDVPAPSFMANATGATGDEVGSGFDAVSALLAAPDSDLPPPASPDVFWAEFEAPAGRTQHVKFDAMLSDPAPASHVSEEWAAVADLTQALQSMESPPVPQPPPPTAIKTAQLDPSPAQQIPDFDWQAFAEFEQPSGAAGLKPVADPAPNDAVANSVQPDGQSAHRIDALEIERFVLAASSMNERTPHSVNSSEPAAAVVPERVDAAPRFAQLSTLMATRFVAETASPAPTSVLVASPAIVVDTVPPVRQAASTPMAIPVQPEPPIAAVMPPAVAEPAQPVFAPEAPVGKPDRVALDDLVEPVAPVAAVAPPTAIADRAQPARTPAPVVQTPAHAAPPVDLDLEAAIAAASAPIVGKPAQPARPPQVVVEPPTRVATRSDVQPAARALGAAEVTQDAPAAAAAPSHTEFTGPAVVLPMARSLIRAEAPPSIAEPSTSLDHLLRLAAARGASTLYLSSCASPSVRVDGEMRPLEGTPVLDASEVEALLLSVMPERDAEALAAGVESEWTCDMAGIGRVRCVAFRDHRGPGGVFRTIPLRAITADQLGLSDDIRSLAFEPGGLVLVAGPRSSGKRTLISALVDLINHTRRDHIVTIGSEINVVHDRHASFVSQREARGASEEAWMLARAALREDPDVLVLEDVRSAQLTNVALEAAAAGQLVIAGLAAYDAANAIDRLIDLYPAGERRHVQLSLSQHLRGVIAQVLARKTGGGRVAARELLLNTSAVANLLADGKTSQLRLAMEGGRKHGMQPLNDALVGYVLAGTIDADEGYRRAADRAGFLALLKRQEADAPAAERLA